MNKHIEETESKNGLWIKELREKEDKLNYENMGQYSIMEYRHNTKRSLENRRRYYHGGYYPEWLEQKHDWLDNAIKQQQEEDMNKISDKYEIGMFGNIRVKNICSIDNKFQFELSGFRVDRKEPDAVKNEYTKSQILLKLIAEAFNNAAEIDTGNTIHDTIVGNTCLFKTENFLGET